MKLTRRQVLRGGAVGFTALLAPPGLRRIASADPR